MIKRLFKTLSTSYIFRTETYLTIETHRTLLRPFRLTDVRKLTKKPNKLQGITRGTLNRYRTQYPKLRKDQKSQEWDRVFFVIEDKKTKKPIGYFEIRHGVGLETLKRSRKYFLESKEYFTKWKSESVLQRYPDLAKFEKQDLEFVDYIVNAHIEKKISSVEFGYALIPSKQHQGIMYEVFSVILGWTYNQGVVDIFAGTLLENEASRNLLRKSDFQLIGCFTKDNIPIGLGPSYLGTAFLHIHKKGA